MSQTPFEEFIKRSRSALSKKKQSTDYRGLNTKHSYSKFWMDNEWDAGSKFGGLSSNTSGTNDLVKVIKLANYQRAVANFVKIVTKKDIPVKFQGSDSYTNGSSITISTDIKENNFDVIVGLALHESSHIVLTDFALLEKLYAGELDIVEDLVTKYDWSRSSTRSLVKNLLNWVEDRRIDNHIFTTSPGYKAYYHKMYDYYWNSKDIIRGFVSEDLRNPQSVDSYLFHVINMISPNFNPAALPRLNEIAKLIDVRNIARLKNTYESLDVAVGVADIIIGEMIKSAQLQTTKQQPEDKDGNDQAPTEKLTDAEKRALNKAFQDQKNFLSGETGKKTATRKMQKQLESAADLDVDVQQVGGTDDVRSRSSLIFDCAGNAMNNYFEQGVNLDAMHEAYSNEEAGPKKEALRLAYYKARNQQDYSIYNRFFHTTGEQREAYVEAVTKGLEMGGLLGKRLQLHNEARIRVDNRLRSGKIDKARLAHAGYGVESVFSQIHVDAYKKANLHISLDGSGSMSGQKWAAAIQMTAAIAKAASYTQNIAVQVSVRATGDNDIPTTLMIYNSKKNRVNHLAARLKALITNSMTPEGLCFESMIKKNYLIPGTAEMQSYFLNISDGAPGCSGYGGQSAENHTKRQVNKMRTELDMQIISYFIEGSSNYNDLQTRFLNDGTGRTFRAMYGKDAGVVDPSNAIMIAQSLNKKFLTK